MTHLFRISCPALRGVRQGKSTKPFHCYLPFCGVILFSPRPPSHQYRSPGFTPVGRVEQPLWVPGLQGGLGRLCSCWWVLMGVRLPPPVGPHSTPLCAGIVGLPGRGLGLLWMSRGHGLIGWVPLPPPPSVRVGVGAAYLPLGCDPDGQAAVVPPRLDAQCGVVGQLHLAARVVEHVVNHPVVLDVFACGVGGCVEEVVGGQEIARAAGKHTPPREPGWAITATCSDSEILLPL